IDPGVTVVPAAGGSCVLLLQAAMNISAARAAIALIVRILISTRRFAPRSRSIALLPRLQTNSTRAIFARVDAQDHILRYCGIKGDHAGSDASVGVGTCRSKRPVMSIALSVTDPARPPELGCWRKNISTRPFGAQVGPSTRKPLASMRSPLPSGRMTPMPKLPPVILVKAM